MTRGEHGHPEVEGYGRTRVEDITAKPTPEAPPGS
jgi:hypothetical protein